MTIFFDSQCTGLEKIPVFLFFSGEIFYQKVRKCVWACMHNFFFLKLLCDVSKSIFRNSCLFCLFCFIFGFIFGCCFLLFKEEIPVSISNCFPGDRCEINPNDCLCDPVGTVTCDDGLDDYTCNCRPGYAGKNCSVSVSVLFLVLLFCGGGGLVFFQGSGSFLFVVACLFVHNCLFFPCFLILCCCYEVCLCILSSFFFFLVFFGFVVVVLGGLFE